MFNLDYQSKISCYLPVFSGLQKVTWGGEFSNLRINRITFFNNGLRTG